MKRNCCEKYTTPLSNGDYHARIDSSMFPTSKMDQSVYSWGTQYPITVSWYSPLARDNTAGTQPLPHSDRQAFKYGEDNGVDRQDCTSFKRGTLFNSLEFFKDV